MIRRFGLVLLTVLLVVSAGSVRAAQDPKDLGVADTVRMLFTVLPDANTNQLNVSMDLYLFNDVQSLNSVSLGFKWWNDNLNMTSATFSPLGMTAFDFIRFLYRNNKLDSTNKYNAFQCTGSRSMSEGLVASMTAKHVATYNFVLTSWTVLDSLVFDTGRVLGAGLAFVDYSNIEYKPFWASKIIIYDANKPIISNLVISEDTLVFESVYGQANPPAQSFNVSSDRDPLTFTLVENAAWLLKTPSGGTTPLDISVSVTNTGLAPGTYFDSVRVESAGASNSPRYVYVRYILHPAQPVIGVDRTAFFFNVITGGDDPTPQTLNISNTGQSDLHWTVSNSESWLSLDPLSGTNAGAVTLTVSSSTLPFGVYYDTVIVSDPNATNDSVKISVRLSVASDLPMIAVDSVINYWPQNWNLEGPMFIRSFGVRNGGFGLMNFWIETNSPRILNITPDTSSAPDSVALLFYIRPDLLGNKPPYLPVTVTDTVWVYSLEAANSPVRVLCVNYLSENPPEIELSTSSINFDVYECWQGYGQSLPTAQFTVTNVGLDDPMLINITYNSERFEVIGADSQHAAPYTYQVNALRPDIPLGNYTDTIWVSSKWAINKPQPIEVHFNYVAGTESPQILVPSTPLVIPWQQDSGPQLFEGFAIFNQNAGCMTYDITESLDWLTPSSTQGSAPDTVPLLVNPEGFAMGQHNASLEVHSSGASNDPLTVPINLMVWKLRGDVNWNGRISVQDIALMLDYVFEGQHPPQPVVEVGDVDCNETVDVSDIILVVEYLFENLVPLCSNPY